MDGCLPAWPLVGQVVADDVLELWAVDLVVLVVAHGGQKLTKVDLAVVVGIVGFHHVWRAGDAGGDRTVDGGDEICCPGDGVVVGDKTVVWGDGVVVGDETAGGGCSLKDVDYRDIYHLRVTPLQHGRQEGRADPHRERLVVTVVVLRRPDRGRARQLAGRDVNVEGPAEPASGA